MGGGGGVVWIVWCQFAPSQPSLRLCVSVFVIFLMIGSFAPLGSNSGCAFPGKRRDGEEMLGEGEELQHLRVQGEEEDGVRNE